MNTITPSAQNTLEALKKTFGFTQFRPHQQTLVDSILAGKDTFGVMPTGGGKSLCYQLPAYILPSCAVIVSPLIALMKDQVDAARNNGLRAAFLNSTLDPTEAQSIENDYRTGNLDLLYLAPERLSTSYTTNLLKNNPPSFFAIDEAHCISDWGHDFRPDYLYLSRLKELFPGVPVAAFTATATHQVGHDIESRLNLQDATKIRASFDRKNLFYEIRAKRDWETQIIDFIRERPDQSGIIYRTSRKAVDQTAALLKANGINAAAYHAGMEAQARSNTQDDFLRDNIHVIVATVAFGMGVDKADVRFVIHGDIPKNIESYYQETGRAGRDGDPSHCLLLYSAGDTVRIRHFIDQIVDQEEKKRTTTLLRHMEQFAAIPKCRRTSLLAYFDETYPAENCNSCDFCAGSYTKIDATTDAQMILSAIMRTSGKFGAVHICDIVTGANTAKIRQFEHDKLKTYGVGKAKPKTHWRTILDALTAAGKLTLSRDQYPVPQINDEGTQILFGHENFQINSDTRIEPEKAKSSTTTEENIPHHTGLFEHLREIRKETADLQNVPPYVVFSDRTLRELAAYQPSNETEILSIHGIGQNKADKYADKFLSAIQEYTINNPDSQTEKQPLPTNRTPSKAITRVLTETYLTTLALLDQGLTAEQIATKRGIAQTTVESHIEKLIQEDKPIDHTKHITPDQETLCRQLFQQHGSTLLKPIIEAANGQLTYGQVKIMRALQNKKTT